MMNLCLLLILMVLGMPPSYADVLVNPDEEIEIEGIK